jgi:hypothetical protein
MYIFIGAARDVSRTNPTIVSSPNFDDSKFNPKYNLQEN